ncbi:MAG: hypothetical protein Tsb0016_18230 [Sphingomonadales bacterium]
MRFLHWAMMAALMALAPASVLAAAVPQDRLAANVEGRQQPHGAADAGNLFAACAVPLPLQHRLIGHVAANLQDHDLPSTAAHAPSLLLRRDDAGYDIVFDNGRLGQWSLRRAGVSIDAAPAMGGFLQLMARQHGVVEQYLFRFDANGEGVLLWSADRGAAGDGAATTTARAECLRSAALKTH